MALIPKTQRKLRETKFFMGKLMQEAQTTKLDKEDFEFLLSAFLTAGRSVRDVLRNEHRSYRAWYQPGWKTKLRSEESQLFDFMQKQRNIEVHRLGAETQESIEMIPLAHASGNSPLYAAYADTGAEIGQKVYYVKINGKHEKALDVCRRYLDLLLRLVDDFDRAFPT
jgi:hypothetical protein